MIYQSYEEENNDKEDESVKSWLKCVGRCGFYFNNTININIIEKTCLKNCNNLYEFSREYEDLKTADLFLSKEIENCLKKSYNSAIVEICIDEIPIKYQKNKNQELLE